MLEFACRQLMLHPHEASARLAMAAAVTATRLEAASQDSAWTRGLLNELEGYGDDLAFRLEQPGCETILAGAAAARFFQSLTILKEQLEQTPAHCALAGERSPR